MQNDDAEHDFTEGKYQKFFAAVLTYEKKYEME